MWRSKPKIGSSPAPGRPHDGRAATVLLRGAVAGACLLAIVAAFAACGNGGAQDGENYGDILSSPDGLVLVEDEHRTGWGRSDCFGCHEIRSMHIVNRTSLPNCNEVADPAAESCIDLPEIQSIIHNGGEQSCMLCHGDNGVPP
jgi:hypothetical protein